MLSSEQRKQLKQKDVSRDTEKTKERFAEDFKTATNREKTRIVELSGQKRNSIYRVFKTGAANARLVLAMAEVLDVTPFYYTGEQDTKDPLQDAFLLLFLKKLGYDKLLAELGEEEAPKSKRKYNRKAKPDETDTGQQAGPSDETQHDVPEQQAEPEADNTDEAILDAEESDAIHIELSLRDSPDMQKAIAELGEDDAIMLLRSLFIRSKAGGQAMQLAELVKRCLLS